MGQTSKIPNPNHDNVLTPKINNPIFENIINCNKL